MERLTNRDEEIPLPNADNALFWARVHEKLARYEDAEEHTYFASKPQTNADRIRAMTDEELAEWLDRGFRNADWCDISKFPNGDCMEVPCLGCIIEWLKQEVKE